LNIGMIEILGLPAHPLLVHLPVVLVPALILAVLGYVLIPPVRVRIGWLVMVLSVLAPLAVYGAWFTGHQFYDMHVATIEAAGADPAKFTNLLDAHLFYGDILIWLVPAMAPLIWLFGALERGRRAAIARRVPTAGATDAPPPAEPVADPAAGGRRIVMVIVALLICGLAGVSGWYVYQSGHSGAEVVWGQPK
jgi:hypothetical protein